MDAALLQKRIALLPGSRDREGGAVMVLPSHGDWAEFPYAEVVGVLRRLSEIPDEATQARGFTLILDMRGAWIRHLKICLRAAQAALYGHIHQVLIVKPEHFLDKSKIALDLLIEAYEFKTQIVSAHKLTRHVDVTQLPVLLGGTYPYDHLAWMTLRMKFESTFREGQGLQKRVKAVATDPSGQAKPVSDGEWAAFVKKAQSVVVELEGEAREDAITGTQIPNPDHIHAAARLKALLNIMQEAEEGKGRDAAAAAAAEVTRVSAAHVALFDHYEAAVDNLVEWLGGPGEKWVLTLRELGESRDEAETLLREHQQLAAKSKDILSQVQDLREMSERLTEEQHPRAPDIALKKSEAEKAAHNFAQRVERQKSIAQRSLQLQLQYEDVWKKLDIVMESLCSDLNIRTADSAATGLQALDAQMADIERLSTSVESEAASLKEELEKRERNWRGREVVRDFSAGILHWRRLLSALAARRLRCADMADVRRLRLQQLRQLFTSEHDALQAIGWIDQLVQRLDGQTERGGGEEDIERRRLDQHKLEQTARTTHGYAEELLQVSLVLRRSLRLGVGPQLDLARQLEDSWANLCRALSAAQTQLSVRESFFSSAGRVEERLEQMAESEASSEDGRRELSLEVRELGAMASTLGAASPSPGAMAEIQERLARVEARQAQLNASLSPASDVSDPRHDRHEPNGVPAAGPKSYGPTQPTLHKDGSALKSSFQVSFPSGGHRAK